MASVIIDIIISLIFLAQAPSNETYLRAVAQMVQPRTDDVSNSLDVIDVKKPVLVVTWTRSGAYQDTKGSWLKKAPSDIWVTVVPRLKAFCSAFAESRRVTPAELTLRLEQHLGLPPGTGKEVFIEMMVKNPSSTKSLFRPCVNPSTTTADCKLGPPPATSNQNHQNWFYRQYYSSYSGTNQYPWTSLGYTFDWAIASDGRSFVKKGESEFVIPRGAAIQILSSTPTEQYCSAQH